MLLWWRTYSRQARSRFYNSYWPVKLYLHGPNQSGLSRNGHRSSWELFDTEQNHQYVYVVSIVNQLSMQYSRLSATAARPPVFRVHQIYIYIYSQYHWLSKQKWNLNKINCLQYCACLVVALQYYKTRATAVLYSAKPDRLHSRMTNRQPNVIGYSVPITAPYYCHQDEAVSAPTVPPPTRERTWCSHS